MSHTIEVTSVGVEVEVVTQGISPFLPGTRGKVIEKPANAPGHAGLVRVGFEGGLDWYFQPTSLRPVPAEAPQDHGPLAATLSERTLAKVLSRPAHVPRETPSLVEMDRRDEMRTLLAEAIFHSTGRVGGLRDVGHSYLIDPFGAAEHILARFDVRAVTR